MRKSLLLTIVFAFAAFAICKAQFAPEPGKMYALKVVDENMFLDIQTQGVNEPNAGRTTNNISLNTMPCVIFFEEGTTAGTWKIKNAKGMYVGVDEQRAWNAVISSSAHEWTIEGNADALTIARENGKYVNVDSKVTGQPLYCDKATAMAFSLVEYSDFYGMVYALKSDAGTYLNLTAAGGTAASFQSTPTYFYMSASADSYFFVDRDDAGRYIGSTHSWNATTDFSLWTMSDADEKGFVSLSREADGTQFLGSDQNTNVGTGIYTNVGSGCNKWLLERFVDVPTVGDTQNGKVHFASESIAYHGACNKLRFTLTESAAYYSNGAKRMSFDSFVLYDANGNEVALNVNNMQGNNNGKNFAGMLDGDNGTYCAGTWQDSAAADDWFELTVGVELGGAFSFAFVTENTTMNAKAFRVELSYVPVTAGYTLAVHAPEAADVVVTYDGEEVAEGSMLGADFDKALFEATEVSGYTWSVAVDEDSKTVTILYAVAPVVENPTAVVELVNRIGGAGTDEKFLFVLDPSLSSKQELFSLGSEDGKIVIKANTMSALTTALGWYLNNHANINIAWNTLNEKAAGEAYADLSSLPLPAEETRTCDAKYRYFFNYCTFGYSMTSWTWKRWQQEIDWMALHGINMPLQIVGLEEVWRLLLTMEENGVRKYNYSDEEAKAFVAGPAFIAWWGMNNLEGWGGTANGSLNGGTWDGAGGVQDDAWYARQKTLATNILTRQRELGMQPVLPGFSGMVPTNFSAKTGVATDANGGKWAGGFQRPRIIDPTAEQFAQIAADYYACLRDVMGESQYYSMDPFHEGGSISSGKYSEAYTAIYDAMEAAKGGSQWVIQQWQWSGNQKLSLSSVPAGRLVVLDLFSDGSPAFDAYGGYAPQDAVFCAIPNFGGRSGLMGRLNNLADNYFSYKAKYPSIKGIGAAPEAIEQTPVTYDLIFQLPWMGSKPDMQAWVKTYATARYGMDNAVVHEAWELLRMGVLNYGADAIQGPVEDVWAARPNLDAKPASAWGKTLNHAGSIYTKARRQMLVDATYKLLSQNEALALAAGSVYESNYNYDIVELGGGVLADYAYDLLLGIKEAKEAAGDNYTADATFVARRDAFLALIADVDSLKGTNLNFRLGKWTQEARDAAAEVQGAATATADWYEYNNARTIVSTWSSPNTNLNDYSYRSWQGLLKDLYLPRWQHYFDNNCTTTEYGYFEWNWAHGMEHYVGQTLVSTKRLAEGDKGYSYEREPQGNTVDEARRVLAKYIIPVKMANGTYYAYRYLTNDLSGMVTIIGNAGAAIDLTQYFGELDGCTITGDFIEGAAADPSNVVIKTDVADGAHVGTITLPDATVLTFAVAVNPAYHGAYNILYNGKPVFIGYNEDLDNYKNVGYKLLDPNGAYSKVAAADEIVLITPNGSGYSLSVQGKYLQNPSTAGWGHVMFSDNSADAGVYLFEETSTADVFRIYSTAGNINYLNDYGDVFGNDKKDKAGLSEFTVAQATYPLEIPKGGVALCLPFNIVLPEGVTAYDVVASDIQNDDEGGYVYKLSQVAVAGDVLLQGTPVVVKGEGSYNVSITMSSNNAKGALQGSLLRGTYMPQTVSGDANIYILSASGDDLERAAGEQVQIPSNSCWVVTTIAADRIVYGGISDTVGISDVQADGDTQGPMYDLMGRKLNRVAAPGIYIVNGKKVLVK